MIILFIEAYITWLVLIIEKEKTLKTFLIYTTDTWSSRVREIYYKKYNINSNKKDINIRT